MWKTSEVLGREQSGKLKRLEEECVSNEREVENKEK